MVSWTVGPRVDFVISIAELREPVFPPTPEFAAGATQLGEQYAESAYSNAYIVNISTYYVHAVGLLMYSKTW